MRKQALVLGLGQFGMSVARALSDRGSEVLAVDIKEDRVRLASTFVTEAVCFDVTDGDALSRTSPEARDVCVCAIGDTSKDSSIICTALLRQFGAKRVIARANDDIHARILRLVGAHDVVNPEFEFGKRFATQLLHEGVIGELPLGNGLIISEFEPPEGFLGKTLIELELPRRFGIMVVAVRDREQASVRVPDPGTPISSRDLLLVVSREGGVAKMMERSK